MSLSVGGQSFQAALTPKDQVSSPDLKENQVLQVLVLDKLPNNKVILFFGGSTFFAETNLSLEKGQALLAKIQSLSPTLILNLIPEESGGKGAASKDPLIDQLRAMNLLPKAETLTAAKAFRTEQIPLKPELFLPFMEQIKNSGLKSSEDVEAAVKLFKLRMPVNSDLVARFREIMSTSGAGPEKVSEFLKTVTQDLKLASSQKIIPVEENAEIRSLTEKIGNQTLENRIESQDKPETIVSKIRNTLDFSGEGFEKKLLSQLYKTLFNEESFQTNYPELKSLIEKASTQLSKVAEANSSGNLPVQNQMQNLSELSALLDKTLQKLSGNENGAQTLPKSLFDFTGEASPSGSISGSHLLRLIQVADKVLSFHFDTLSRMANPMTSSMIKEGSGSTTDEIYTKIGERITRLFDPGKVLKSDNNDTGTFLEDAHKTVMKKDPSLDEVPVQKEKPDHSAPAYARHENLKMPSNLKEELFKLRDLIHELSSRKDLPSPLSQGPENSPLSKIGEETEKLLNGIYKDQLNSLAEDPSGKVGNFSMVFDENGKTKEVKFFYKEQSSKDSMGAPSKSFLIFFSLELSKLGYFEMNVLDMNGKLDITFFSEKASVREFFETHSGELEQSLKTFSSGSVSVKTAIPRKMTREAEGGNKLSDKGKKASGRIDIII